MVCSYKTLMKTKGQDCCLCHGFSDFSLQKSAGYLDTWTEMYYYFFNQVSYVSWQSSILLSCIRTLCLHGQILLWTPHSSFDKPGPIPSSSVLHQWFTFPTIVIPSIVSHLLTSIFRHMQSEFHKYSHHVLSSEWASTKWTPNKHLIHKSLLWVRW